MLQMYLSSCNVCHSSFCAILTVKGGLFSEVLHMRFNSVSLHEYIIRICIVSKIFTFYHAAATTCTISMSNCT